MAILQGKEPELGLVVSSVRLEAPAMAERATDIEEGLLLVRAGCSSVVGPAFSTVT